ncbi:aspartate/glutamate racemase family protein [Fulvivirga sp. M361]|uniref:aspartate/glutamate racemase family protein n=1 Tax=Fulvivirga sp. M361 TaxID=2594266 RepID=UPI00117AA865|nr:aspartate/glutamate racemase family protein [Fulvivirga sp. M361]TRX59933.1 aspartate/glutamate racemase family protein [Fulvivirga sp. M361]
MKTIGLIGGMSWESSKVYYKLINERVKELLGGTHSCKSIMISVDFNEIERLTFENKWDEIGEMMAACAQQLEQAGADIILLCTNTIHMVSDAITQSVTIPFLHIAEATGQEISSQKLKKVALLGTKFTMEKDFYTGILKKRYGLEVVIPREEDRQIVHDLIYNELVLGKFTTASKEKCKRIIGQLVIEGAEGVILGCTELPLLIPSQELDVPSFDTSKIHAYKGVEWALDG